MIVESVRTEEPITAGNYSRGAERWSVILLIVVVCVPSG